MLNIRGSVIQALAIAILAALALAAGDTPRPAPPLRVKTLNGDVRSLWVLRGKVVVVMFFSSNCPHCQKAAEILNPVYEELKPRGLEILGLAENTQAQDNLANFAEAHHVTFPLGLGSRVDWARFGQFSVHAKPPYVPHLLFVDRAGMIRADYRGENRQFYEDLAVNFRNIVEPLLNESSARKPLTE